ncbi:MAG TPA: hypothetical protein PKZ75_05060 [Bacteroidia bacterium]|nr:hypothetical protein [Bacteroidia bacterium]
MTILFSSCVLHKAYVPAGYEPVVVSEKNDKQFALTLRPLDYLNLDYTHAITNHIALRGTIGGTYQLYNGMASLIYFNKIKNYNYFIAPLYSYQNNQIQRSNAGLSGMFFQETACNYNCVYNSAGLAFGFSIRKQRIQHHITIKEQYNFVDRYNFAYESDNGSGKSSGYIKFDDENLKKVIPPFFSMEPSYAILFKAGRSKFLKLQATINICEKTFTHNYSFDDGGYVSKNVDAVKQHPRSWPINLSVGFIFSSKKETKMTE